MNPIKFILSRIAFVLLALAPLTPAACAKELSELTLLYVGSARSGEYVAFLKPNVARIETRPRAGFNVADAAAFDVVLLDWPQGDDTREMRKLTSPLGQRDGWTKPTVLLGSAGLNLAVAWQMKGGNGCTCMSPLAYGLRDHEIFDRPFAIDRGRMISIPTPQDFAGEIKESHIKVLPLVDDHTRSWKAGWCTYSNDFAANPDVEFFCGGVNAKTPTAAGLWRQGNLLHFGFEQSPAEMNEQGRLLMLNSIAYISRFTEDRPIAITRSVFAGPVARSRGTPARWLRDPEHRMSWVTDMLTDELARNVSPLSREAMAAWFDRNQSFLHPTPEYKLEMDKDLEALGVAFDQPEFFDKTLADLQVEGAASDRARRLLERYVPAGPKGGNADRWSAWWRENKPYAFASDSGDYCWYVDPLAKKRGVPTSELRGPRRADIVGGP